MRFKYYIFAFLLVLIITILPMFIPGAISDRALWVNGVGALGTFGALLFLILEKFEKDKADKEIFWHEHLPYLTIGSPCDPTQNRCEINLLTNVDEIGERGALLFSIVNFSSSNAYNITVEFSTTKIFEADSSRQHYIDFIPVFVPPVDANSFGNGVNFIYSKYHIDPVKMEVVLDEFDICEFTNNCEAERGFKTIFIKLKYHSTPAVSIQKEIVSVFKVDLECGNIDGKRTVIINNIIQVDYHSTV